MPELKLEYIPVLKSLTPCNELRSSLPKLSPGKVSNFLVQLVKRIMPNMIAIKYLFFILFIFQSEINAVFF
jgi:hypothetical protein